LKHWLLARTRTVEQYIQQQCRIILRSLECDDLAAADAATVGRAPTARAATSRSDLTTTTGKP